MTHSIDISEKGGVRYLHFGSSWVQGAMRITRPWALELAYTREMMAGLLLQPMENWPRTALLIGLGAASQVRFIHRHLPACRITAVEINPAVAAAARQFFRLAEASERLDLIIDDAASFISTADESYDMILIDAFDADGNSGALAEAGFFAHCKEKLAADGILSCNLLTREKAYPAVSAALQSVFGPHCRILPPCSSGNAVALATAGRKIDFDSAEIALRCEQLKNTTQLDLSSLLERLR